MPTLGGDFVPIIVRAIPDRRMEYAVELEPYALPHYKLDDNKNPEKVYPEGLDEHSSPGYVKMPVYHLGSLK